MPQFVDLKPGQVVTVFADRAADDPYETRIRDITAELVRLDVPRRGRESLAVSTGEPLTLQTELRGSLYSFSSRVRDVPQPPGELLTIDVPSVVDQTERRQLYRLDTAIPTRYSAVVDEDREELERITAVVMDISGNGMQLRVKEPVDMGARLRLIFDFGPEPFEFDVDAEVLAFRAELRASQFRAHARLLDPVRRDQEQLIRSIFLEQVERLRRGVQ